MLGDTEDRMLWAPRPLARELLAIELALHPTGRNATAPSHQVRDARHTVGGKVSALDTSNV